MDPILDGLNSAQHAAVTSPVNVLQVLAPPGSGKTKTLTSRVAYLLRHFDYKPWNVICLTFTIKSSKEMKERISKLIGHGTEKKLILGTFHSICRRYLAAYGHLIGMSKDFGIADSSDQFSIIKRIHRRLGLTIDPKVAQSRISNSKSKGLSYHDLAHELRKKKDVEQREIVTLFEAYEAQLATSNLLDYDDLLLRCVYLLRTHPSCVSNVEVVLVDEFQDTNIVQFDLLRLFAAQTNRITTVGDPDQSIYGWRSAEVKNLKKMQKQYPDTLIIQLEDNYRSSGAILLAAQEVIEQDESRPQKLILPTHCPGTVPVLRKLPSANIEAEWTVGEIQRTMALTGHLLKYSDFAILIRTVALSRLLESAMGKAGIPYRMVGGQKFFDRVEIKILLDYLRVISQPHNNDALVRIINIPARGIGAATTKALLEEAEVQKETLWALIQKILKGYRSAKTKTSKAAEQGLSALTNIIITTNKMLDPSNPQSPEELLRLVIKKLDFQGYLEKSHPEDHESRWANVEELIAQASDYRIPSLESISKEEGDECLPQIDGLEQERGNGAEEVLSKFLANVALAAAADVAKEEDAEDSQTQSQVTISTIHAAKGLEWPVVFILSAYEGSIPHSRAEDTDEERRLLYVAMTRAQALLYMSYPVKNSQREETKLSPFLSTKKVGHIFINQGPAINVPAVVDIARILRRECPSREKIEEESQVLRSAYDDLLPLTGEESIDAIQKRRSNWDDCETTGRGQHPYKRPRLVRDLSDSTRSCVVSKSTKFIGSSTTMENSTSFSRQVSAGFSTAAVQLQLAREARDTVQRSASPEKNVNGGAGKRPKQCKEGADLLSMWGAQNKAETGSSKTHVPAFASREDIAVLSNKSVLKEAREAAPRFPLTIIPQELAAHRLNPVMRKPTPSEYVFLSSSSPPPEHEGEKLDDTVRFIADEPGANKKIRFTADEFVGDKRMRCPAGEAAPIVRPAHAFPITAISQVRSTSNISKKTLGVQRNIVGWSARPGSSFKVPTMASKQR